MAGRSPVAELFARLLPAGARFATRVIEGDAPALFPEEELAVARALERRRRPFSFGRACAREALGRDVAIAAGPNREPMWPPGIIGSITHTDGHAAAAVIDNLTDGGPGRVRSIGIDLESLAHAAQTPDLLTMVATPAERAALSHGISVATAMAVASEHLAALMFSAKESVYKCLYPLIATFLDFHDVELVFDVSGFIARPKGFDLEVRGQFAVDDTHVATVAVT